MTKKKETAFSSAVKTMDTLTPEEEAELEGRPAPAAPRRGIGEIEEEDKLEGKDEEREPIDQVSRRDIPKWVVIPPDFVFPREGRQVAFMRFPSAWTTRPELGLVYEGQELPFNASDAKKAIKYPYEGQRHRQCILWTLTVNEEKLARKAADGDGLAVSPEMTKRCIRAIDGVSADMSKGRMSNTASFWEEVGAACRQQLVNYYHRTHAMSEEQKAYFFLFGFAVRSVVTG